MIRLARASVAALLILLFAVTPLSALIWPSQFQIVFTDGLRVKLEDRTGLVRGLAHGVSLPGVRPPVENHGSDTKTLLVRVEGSSCDAHMTLTIGRDGDGYFITERTETHSCALGTGMERVIAIVLWSPIAAGDVRFESLS